MEDNLVIDRFEGDRRLKNNSERSRNSIIFLVISLVLTAIKGGYLHGLDMGYFYFDQLGYRIMVMIIFINFILTVVFFIRWFRGIYQNAATLKGGKVNYPESWVVWGWIIPFWNWMVPFQIMREIRRVYVRESSVDEKKYFPMFIWWGCWVLNGVIYFIPVLLEYKIPLVIGDLISVLSGIFAILMIRDFTNIERKLLGI